MSVMKHDKFDRFHVIKTSSIVFLIFLVFYNSKYMTHGQTQRRDGLTDGKDSSNQYVIPVT